MRTILKITLIIITALVFVKCGDPGVSINEANYEPKISVEAYLYGGETVNDIRISRNFALGSPIDFNKLYLSPAENSVNISINGIPLEYDPQTKTYFNNNIVAEYGKTYQLNVSAVIDGKELSAEAVTTVPKQGFKLMGPSDLGDIKYYVEKPVIDFAPSSGTDLYVFSVLAENPSVKSFIYDNPYFSDIDSNDVKDNYNDYRYQLEVIGNIDSDVDRIYSAQIQYYELWFYGKYRTIAYAGDKNFRNYLFTAPNVKEFDGNFHEPIQIFTGDGIGVFASAIRDTVYFNLVK